MALTKEDLQAIGQLVESKLEPIKFDISGIKTDIVEMKSDIAEMKSDIYEIKAELSELHNGINAIVEWVDGIERNQKAV